MKFKLEKVLLRPLTFIDANDIKKHADDRDVWLTLTDEFPHPYLRSDALDFITHAQNDEPNIHLGIEYEGEVIGVVSAIFGKGIYRYNCELGYWIGSDYWNKGLMSEVLNFFVPYLHDNFTLKKIFARIFATNYSSQRILKKLGFQLEVNFQNHIVKDNKMYDEHFYSLFL